MRQTGDGEHPKVVVGPALPVPLPTDSPAIELIGRWLELSELDRRAFVALARELTVSSDLVESSTLDLSARFQTLATMAQAQMGRVESIIAVAKSIEVNGEAVPLDAAMHDAEGVLRKVIETIVTISKHAVRMVDALDEVARDVAGAEQCVARIEAINTQTRYLALNAAIEASRSGEAAAAFQVIAREIKELSQATDETSRQVRERISSVSRGVRTGHDVLQEIANMDMSEHLAAKDQLHALISGIISQNIAFGAVLTDAAGASADIAGTIGQVISGMQFQDRTKQHIGHVVDALAALGEGTLSVQTATLAAFPGVFEVGAIDRDRLHQIVEKQTLGAVRQRILTRLLNGDDAGEDGGVHDAGGEVELF